MAKLEKKNVANTNSTDKYKIIIAVLATALAAALIALGVSYFGNDEVIDQNEAIEQFIGADKAAQTELTKAEQERLYGVVGEALTNARNSNYYASVQDGAETYVSMCYNKNGGAFAHASETGYISVFRGDGKAIRFTDYVEFGDDCDVLTQLEHVHQMLGEGKAEAYGVTADESNEYFDQLIIDVRGMEGARALHSKTSKEYADIMMVSLEEALKNASADSTTGIKADDDINFRFIYVVDKESKFLYSAACYLYFGDTKGEDITWADLFGSWGYSGAIEVYDWEMLDGWTTMDWENVSEWETVEPAEKLLEEQYHIVNDMIGKFADDNGLREDAEETTESGTTESNTTADSSNTSEGPLGTVTTNEDGSVTINLGGTTEESDAE